MTKERRQTQIIAGSADGQRQKHPYNNNNNNNNNWSKQMTKQN